VFTRFLIGALIIVLASASATAVAGWHEVDKVVHAFQNTKHIKGIDDVITEADAGKPQTILLMGSDKRSKNAADYRRGLVGKPLSLSLAQLRALPQRTQITRHDCVEGWSAIGQWTGPQLSAILAMAGLKPEAKYIVFRCADTLGGAFYYESCDLDDAFHPQTIIGRRLAAVADRASRNMLGRVKLAQTPAYHW